MKRRALVAALFASLVACDEKAGGPVSRFTPASAVKPEGSAAIAPAPVEDAAPPAPKKTKADCKVADVIEFTDPVWEKAVKFALAVDGGTIEKVKKTDLATIKTLNLQRWGKAKELDICLLPLMTSLKELDLGSANVDDLSPVESVPTLELLRAPFTRVQDLAPVAKLGRLTTLDVAHTLVGDISPLRLLTNLKVVVLDGDTSVQDVSPLSTSLGLETLLVSKTGVSTLAPLSDLRHLKKLDISGSSVGDLSPLAFQMSHGLKVVK